MVGVKTWNYLPVELLDMVLENTEPETQKVCSLVCREWLEVSRRHIFDAVAVRSDTSFDTFLQFLTTHPHISHHIRKMYLLGPEHNPPMSPNPFPSIHPLTLVDLATSASNVFCIKLKTVRLVDVPEDERARLASLPGPIQLTDFSLTSYSLGPTFDHCPFAIVRLFYLFEAEMMQIELSSRWGSSPLKEADDKPPPVVVPWYVHQQGLCLKKIRDTRPTYLLALTGFLVPGSLHLLHLAFENWSHCEEMGRFLQHVGEFITDFTITFGHALSYFEFRQHIPTEEEWASYGFSHLRNLSKLRFDLDEPLTCNFANEPKSWLDSAGIPRFLACFPRTLPLRDGVDIDLRYVGDIVGHGYGMVKPRREIDDALFRFENLNLVALCPSSSYGCDLAVDIGAEAFPRLWETRKLACMDEVEESCCL